MARFRYDPAVVVRFPGLVGGVIHAVGVTNGPPPPALKAAFEAEQRAARERIGDTPLSELPTLAAWRRVFRGFGVDPTQYRSAAEALLRRLTKQGELPSIDTLVDLANLASVRHALPVAVFDLRGVHGGIVVRLARGDEPWADLGASETEHPGPGEVIFADDLDVVSARRWCWRQSAASAARDDTTEILVTVEGHHDTAADDVAAALGDLESLLRAHATPTSLRRAMLDSGQPTFDSQPQGVAMRVTRIYSDPEGVSHFEDLDVPLAPTQYAPPADPIDVSERFPASGAVFFSIPAGYVGDWHPTPRRQIYYALSGGLEVEVSDGQRRTFRAGDVALVEDEFEPGHVTRAVGDEPATGAFVHLD